MRIGVDGYNLAMPHGTGVATYAAELVDVLHLLGHEVEGVFGIAVPASAPLRQAVFFDRYRRVATPPPRPKRMRRYWNRLARQWQVFGPHCATDVALDRQVTTSADGTAAIPQFDRLVTVGRLFDDAALYFQRTGRFLTVRMPRPPRVMHWTYPVPVRVAGSRNIYTLHDLVPLKLPYTTLDDKTVYGRVVARCIETAAQICTVSESSKSDIVERFGIDPGRVTNTYQSSSLPPATLFADSIDDAKAVEGIFGLRHREYFLYYGAIEPKKNVGRLIEAYLAMQSITPLVMVGGRAWQSEDELRLMPEGGAGGAPGTFHGHRGQTVIRLDYLPRDLLLKLVRGAKALVFPSLYEGFGLPVLEAMQLGTPVITSDRSSLPEIAGDAALLVDPYDVAAIQAAMTRLDADEALGSSLSAKGREQAKLFSAERYGERLTNLYEAAMASR